jgi:hypothetical protein
MDEAFLAINLVDKPFADIFGPLRFLQNAAPGYLLVQTNASPATSLVHPHPAAGPARRSARVGARVGAGPPSSSAHETDRALRSPTSGGSVPAARVWMLIVRSRGRHDQAGRRTDVLQA